MLAIFSARQSVEVRELRTTVAEIASSLTPELDKDTRAQRRARLDEASRRLDKLLAVPC